MARSCLAAAARVARWADAALGPGRDGATADGKATLSDASAERAARDLGLTTAQVRADWDTARLAGLIEVHGDTARPGWRLRAWDRDDAAVLRGWVALFDAWSLARPAPGATDPGMVAEAVEAAPQLLSLMHLSAGPVTEAALLDMLRQRVAELRAERGPGREPGPEPGAEPSAEPGPGGALPADGATGTHPDGAPPASGTGRPPAGPPAGPPAAGEPRTADLIGLLDWALDGLAAVGALTRCADGGRPAGGQAVLTPLGNWAVWMKLEQICVAAQSPAGNIEQSAEQMLRGCAGLSPGTARAEYRAWLAARPTGPAVTELLDAARGEDALVRGLAFEALRVVGAPAEAAVREVAGEPTLRPYALLWLAEHEGADPEDLTTTSKVLTREEATWLWVDTAAAVADHGEAPLLVRHLESAVQPTVPALLTEVRAVGHPRTVQVLVALAAAHPDPALAKAVRRAAFQVHTGG